jgi:hypothetical protein
MNAVRHEVSAAVSREFRTFSRPATVSWVAMAGERILEAIATL